MFGGTDNVARSLYIQKKDPAKETKRYANLDQNTEAAPYQAAYERDHSSKALIHESHMYYGRISSRHHAACFRSFVEQRPVLTAAGWIVHPYPTVPETFAKTPRILNGIDVLQLAKGSFTQQVVETYGTSYHPEAKEIISLYDRTSRDFQEMCKGADVKVVKESNTNMTDNSASEMIKSFFCGEEPPNMLMIRSALANLGFGAVFWSAVFNELVGEHFITSIPNSVPDEQTIEMKHDMVTVATFVFYLNFVKDTSDLRLSIERGLRMETPDPLIQMALSYVYGIASFPKDSSLYRPSKCVNLIVSSSETEHWVSVHTNQGSKTLYYNHNNRTYCFTTRNDARTDDLLWGTLRTFYPIHKDRTSMRLSDAPWAPPVGGYVYVCPPKGLVLKLPNTEYPRVTLRVHQSDGSMVTTRDFCVLYDPTSQANIVVNPAQLNSGQHGMNMVLRPFPREPKMVISTC